MLAGLLALIVAAVFAGAALYISLAELPAQLALDDRAMLIAWRHSFERGFALQAPLTVIGCLLGLVAWWLIGGGGFLVGAVAMIANVPWTLIVIMPVNNALKATAPEATGPATRALVTRWGRLHAIRTGLGFIAALAFALGCL